MTVSGRRSGRLSVAGLIAMRPGSRTRLCHRLRTHPAGRGKRRSLANLAVVALDRLETSYATGSNACSTDPTPSTAS
ncbi:hypothetical protein P3T27_007227 [Kitasatospora sp. MAA19]|nr:hypothetical protein [Kitasatospora sp. MAA19]MDH6710477.1 hypothetical protein [Kitasatospora sp. MAA19]